MSPASSYSANLGRKQPRPPRSPPLLCRDQPPCYAKLQILPSNAPTCRFFLDRPIVLSLSKESLIFSLKQRHSKHQSYSRLNHIPRSPRPRSPRAHGNRV